MTLPVAGALILLAALIELTLGARTELGGAQPGLVLVVVASATWLKGARHGLAWAVGGGLLLDLGSPGPLGLRALGMVAAAYVTAVFVSSFDGGRVFGPALGAALASVGYFAVLLAAGDTLGLGSPPPRQALQLVAGSALYAALLMPPVLEMLRRLDAKSSRAGHRTPGAAVEGTVW